MSTACGVADPRTVLDKFCTFDSFTWTRVAVAGMVWDGFICRVTGPVRGKLIGWPRPAVGAAAPRRPRPKPHSPSTAETPGFQETNIIAIVTEFKEIRHSDRPGLSVDLCCDLLDELHNAGRVEPGRSILRLAP